jgi:hypothetical protein
MGGISVNVSGAKLVAAALVLFGTVAVGAPEKPGGIPEKRVYPLEKQDGVWWAGVADVCAIAGAKVEGAGGFARIDAPAGRGYAIIPQLSGKGPVKITVGADVYQFSAGSATLTRNGERIWDFVHTPKAISGCACASLEDLCHMLGLAEGDEADGQPTIMKGEARYRLIKGAPKLSLKVEYRDMRPPAFAWPRAATGGYAGFNGLLYQTAPMGTQYVQPKEGTPGATIVGSQRLYGPVIPGRFSGNYQGQQVRGDQLFLSIVDVKGPTEVLSAGSALTVPLGAAALRQMIAAEEARLNAVDAALKQPGLQPDARERLERERAAIERSLDGLRKLLIEEQGAAK